MKVLILAGGYGTRLSEETANIPKPMLKIGEKPMLWHIMKLYSHYGFNEFIILLGYKGYAVKEYFANYFLHESDVTIDIGSNNIEVHSNTAEPWKVTLLDTGLDSMTGGRVKKAQQFVGNNPFMLTYGDGLADINISELLKFHRSQGGIVTLTAIQPEGKFGAVNIQENNNISQFLEKPKGDQSWVNGGFFVCEPEAFDYIKLGDKTVFELEPLQTLARDNKLMAYKHFGFWKCMDTLRDKNQLQDMWENNRAKWKIW